MKEITQKVQPAREPRKMNKVPAYVGRTMDVYQGEDGGYILRNKISGIEYPITHDKAIAWVDAQLRGEAINVPLQLH